MTNFIIEASSISKQVETPSYSLSILQGLALEIKSGEVVAIMGASGSGKSTLLSILAGLEPPTAGSLQVLGQSLAGMTEDQLAIFRRDNIGFIFQDFQLIPTLTALDNVMLPLHLRGSYATENAVALLTRLGLEQRQTHYPSQLSGGEQQRVAVARAFIHRPKLVFADEPTGNLDETTSNSVVELLFDIQRESASTLVIVTHDRMLAARCDKQYSLQHGTLTPMVNEPSREDR